MSRTFLDIPAGQELVLSGLGDAKHLTGVGLHTVARGGNSHLLAAQALVLVRRRFVVQDDLGRNAKDLGRLALDVGADSVELQKAVGEFVVACGADWARDSVIDPTVAGWRELELLYGVGARHLEALLDEPPVVLDERSNAPVEEVLKGSFELEAMFAFGGSGKVEVTRETLADGTVRVTLTGEAAALAGLGLGVKIQAEGGHASADAQAGAFASASWDCASQEDADRLLARIMASSAAAAGGGLVARLPGSGVSTGYWAGGADRLRVPEPNVVEVGVLGGVRGEAGVGAGATAGLAAALRVTESVVRQRDGALSGKVKIEGSVRGEVSLPDPKLPVIKAVGGGALTISATMEISGGLKASAEIKISGELAGGPGVTGVGGGMTSGIRTDITIKLDRAALNSPQGTALMDALQRGDMDAAKRILPSVVGGSVEVGVWQVDKTKIGVDLEGDYVGKGKIKVGGEVSRERNAGSATLAQGGHQGD